MGRAGPKLFSLLRAGPGRDRSHAGRAGPGQKNPALADFYNELELFKTFMPEKHTLQEILSFIYENDLNTLLPNLFIALRIMIIMPVSVATGE